MPRADSPLRDRVIFLVGARRSGTNWLERILTAHPAIVAVPTETYLFSHGLQPLTERFQHANPGAVAMGQTFVQRNTLLDAFRDLVDPILLETLEREDQGARYIVERTPLHASHLPLIADVYPDARVMNIVRDARAVARSLVSMPWGPDTLEKAAAEWCEAVQDAREGARALGDRYTEVIYETLLEDPRRHTAELFARLDLTLPDDVWDTILAEAGSEFNVDPASPGVGPDKWRKELSQAEIASIERVAGPQLTALGYELVTGGGGGGRAGRRVSGVVANGRLRELAGKLNTPRDAARVARDKASARRMHAVQLQHHEVVADFERLVADGNDAAARDLLSPRLWMRVDEGAGVREQRGTAAIDDLLATLRDHRERGMNVLTGHLHASPHDLTTVASYQLDDQTRWCRTLVYRVRGGLLTNVALYRYELQVAAPAAVSSDPAVPR